MEKEPRDKHGRTKQELALEIQDRITHYYYQTDCTYSFPNSREGDLLKMVHRLLDKSTIS